MSFKFQFESIGIELDLKLYLFRLTIPLSWEPQPKISTSSWRPLKLPNSVQVAVNEFKTEQIPVPESSNLRSTVRWTFQENQHILLTRLPAHKMKFVIGWPTNKFTTSDGKTASSHLDASHRPEVERCLIKFFPHSIHEKFDKMADQEIRRFARIDVLQNE